MNIKTIDDRFATTGQIRPSDIEDIKSKGYVGIVCARPDNEEAGQPSYAEVSAAAEKAGLKVAHVPVSGPLSEGQIIRFEQAMAEMDGPVLGYCRSGARAGSLYATFNR
ncbi:TIGR01244 family sulfur transferase [Pelagibacterium luteolum]|uniref:TIGR01244 family protein n=1 Tax=Pelagibacterium luteolum TaxID=440168 RepID=A0A1G7XAW8_9HYPH|nr:TIGR01244 family sulfur transferase [Pelagibacterium luteolum]SDG81405.1 TIGR01244 family protein [Pelagibacterium luteolum]